MLPSELVSKPVNEWTIDDLNLIVERQSEESQFLEFKEYMPIKNQGLGWNFNGILHANQRDGLAKEIVAFANAYGGHLIVGIKETEEKPSRAEKLGDLNDNVAELAERLRSALSSIIDPPINGLRIHPIPKTEKGQGFLAFHVPQSIHAPHGFGNPPSAYVRRADRSEPMSMRDLQNVFWEARTRRERIVDEFLKVRNEFDQTDFNRGEFRIACVAITENACFSDSLPEAVSIQNPRKWTGIYQVEGGGIFRGPENCPGGWFPDVRGLRAEFKDSDRSEYWHVDETGVVSLNFRFIGLPEKDYSQLDEKIFLISPIWLVSSLKIFVDFVKLVGLSFENRSWILKIFCQTQKDSGLFVKVNQFGDRKSASFPTLIETKEIEINFSQEEDILASLKEIERKLWDIFGIPVSSRKLIFK